MPRLFVACLLALGLLSVRTATTARAAESNLVQTAHDTASLVSDADLYRPGGALRVGLRLRLAPGWHTYWSNPGDAGDAASLAVVAAGAAGGGGKEILWPAPHRLPDGPLMSYGYVGDVLLPVRLSLRPATSQGGVSLTLRAEADWLACARVCVPEHGVFRLALPQGTGRPSPQAGLFNSAEARLPVTSPFMASLSRSGTLQLVGRGLGPASVQDAWFLPAHPGVIDQSAAQPVSIRTGSVALALRPPPDGRLPDSLDGLMVLRDAQGNESFLAVHAAPAAAAMREGGLPGLARLLLLAFAGGLVLNLMPCVFPVLAIKALGLARLGGESRRAARSGAAFYTLGVVCAFAATGGLLLGLRAGGASLGWGFQFQSTVFVALACWLMFGVGLNLAGLFEIGLGAQGIGAGLAARNGAAADFATGLLAVLVAAPCTAPFMAAAVAGALAGSVVAGLLLFAVMGLGLALPYVVLALLPGLARRLPRPGGWMLILRQALSFPMFATSVWLLWVAAVQRGDTAVLLLGAGLVVLGLGGWLFGLSQRLGSRVRTGCAAAALLCLAASLALLPGLDGAAPAAASRAAADAAPGIDAAFSPDRLASLRTEGRPVFVDMTAAWCVVCLVNERVALASAPVRAAFARRGVVLMRGDWTSRDAAITTYLRGFGRDGVPLYVFYPPHGEGRLLPQVLTRGAVLGAVGGVS